MLTIMLPAHPVMREMARIGMEESLALAAAAMQSFLDPFGFFAPVRQQSPPSKGDDEKE